MLAVCGGGHFLMMRIEKERNQQAVQRPDQVTAAPESVDRVLGSKAAASEGPAPLPERPARDAG